MNDNDALEQAYCNGYEDGSKAGYDIGRRYGVCEFEAYLFAWAYANGGIKDIKIDDLSELRETYLDFVEGSEKK